MSTSISTDTVQARPKTRITARNEALEGLTLTGRIELSGKDIREIELRQYYGGSGATSKFKFNSVYNIEVVIETLQKMKDAILDFQNAPE